MALNLNLVDTLADEFGDSEGEEELEEEPMPGLLKVVSEMTKENTKNSNLLEANQLTKLNKDNEKALMLHGLTSPTGEAPVSFDETLAAMDAGWMLRGCQAYYDEMKACTSYRARLVG